MSYYLYLCPCRLTKFGVVTHTGVGAVFLGISHAIEYCRNASRHLSATAEKKLLVFKPVYDVATSIGVKRNVACKRVL